MNATSARVFVDSHAVPMLLLALHLSMQFREHQCKPVESLRQWRWRSITQGGGASLSF